MVTSKFVKETRIIASPAAVFRFHEDPSALSLLIPPWEKMRLLERIGSLEPGGRVILQGRVGPIPVRWVAVHTEYAPPHLFVDEQESGPFAYWRHQHMFLDDAQGGTILRDEVDYAAPLGWLGHLCGGWLIRRKLEAMFAYRHDVTKRAVESAEQ
ncbi:MAG: SRPBCC family protein [Planctomycetaceae bacterium]